MKALCRADTLVIWKLDRLERDRSSAQDAEQRHTYEDIAKIWTSEPERFIVNPIHQMPGLNT